MKSLLLATLATGALLVSSNAEDYKIPKKEPVFSLSFPEGWSVTHEDESVDAVSSDKTIEFYAQTDDADSLEDSVKDAIEYLTKEGVKIKADTEKKVDGEINGMKSANIHWDGTDKDGDCRVSLTFLDIGDDEVITLIYWGSIDGTQKHGEELNKIVNSMKLLKKAEKAEKEEEKEDEDEDDKK